MFAEFSYAHFEWSFCAIYYYVHNQNIHFVEQGAWQKVALLFKRGYQALHCVHAVFFAGISMSCIEAPYAYRQKVQLFFLHLIS